MEIDHPGLVAGMHAVIHAISDGGGFENFGQQLLLVAFTPAIHKIYREICQRFPTLPPDDVAQQAWVTFLETAKSPAMLRQNGQLPVALVMNSRKAMLRWAMREVRRTSIAQVGFEGLSEPLSEGNFEGAILLEDFLRQAKREGLLSECERHLLLNSSLQGSSTSYVVGVGRTGVTAGGGSYSISLGPSLLPGTAAVLQNHSSNITTIPYVGYVLNPAAATCKVAGN